MDKDWGIKDSCIKGIDKALAVSLDVGALLGAIEETVGSYVLGTAYRNSMVGCGMLV